MEQILTYLKQLVSIGSVTETKDEILAAKCIGQILDEQDYFVHYPEFTGQFALEKDHFKRTIPFGFVKGNQDKTIIFTGHYDVVGVDEYGYYKKLAFDIDRLTEALEKDQSLSQEARADLESGDWLFGRGVADMKGGLAAALGVLDQYGKAVMNHPEIQFCNLLFFAVPDEESYSLGMKGAIPLLKQLQKEYGCQYDCCIDLEPGSQCEGKQKVYLGSVGKCMPVILVQGVKAHVGECFTGLSALGVLNQMFLETELSPDFHEAYEGDSCMPPTWLALRDLKEEYDVSLPYRAVGYLNILSYQSTPEMILKKLITIGKKVFDDYEKRLDYYGRSILGEEAKQIRRKKGSVLEFRELLQICRENCGSGFDQRYCEMCREVNEKVINGESHVPNAIENLIRQVLELSGILDPVMIIGFAPIYYPAYHSDDLEGKEGAGSKFFTIAKEAAELYGVELVKSHYFGGISDLSYCGISKKFSTEKFVLNTPLWDYGFEIDLNGIAELNIPAILLGPWGKDIHQRTERINVLSVTEQIPHILWQMLTQLSKA